MAVSVTAVSSLDAIASGIACLTEDFDFKGNKGEIGINNRYENGHTTTLLNGLMLDDQILSDGVL
jgi:hypothetical protein